MRPRNGLNLRTACGVALDETIRRTAGINADETITICPNYIQNILVASTPDEETAGKLAKIRSIKMGDKEHEVSAYVSAPEEMVKGIIRDVPLSYTQDQLSRALITTRNPNLAYAKRLGNTATVILLYEGNRVPTWVYFNSIMIRVALYRKQLDFCRECGRLGHRADVCPRPEVKLCLICGMKNPSAEHKCSPKCKICGEAHPTADRVCKAKYKVPYVVKTRRWLAKSRDSLEYGEKKALTREDGGEDQYPALPQNPSSGRRPRSCSRSRSDSRQRDEASAHNSSSPARGRKSRSRRKSRSLSRSQSRTARNSNGESRFASGNGRSPPGGMPKGPLKVAWSDMAAGKRGEPRRIFIP
ncbi:hypothetical protein MTO96_010468 [Rhipicephalus appendiculatus]